MMTPNFFWKPQNETNHFAFESNTEASNKVFFQASDLANIRHYQGPKTPKRLFGFSGALYCQKCLISGPLKS